MTFLFDGQPYNPLAHDLYQRFIDQAPPEFRACLAAGCEMVTTSRIDESGLHITMTTKNPVAVVEQGGQTMVYEKRVAESTS